MKRSVFTRILSLMLCLVMCCGIPFVLPTVAGDVPFGQTGLKADVNAATDISVMSYNVLYGGDATYAASSVRMPMAVDIVKRYDPDLIGFQEVTTTSANNWVSYLKNSSTGISSTYGLAVMQDSMTTVGSALVIAYKKDRFTLVNSGYTQYADYGRQKRKYQWVELTDKVSGKKIIMTNTHLSIDADTTTADAAGGTAQRKNQGAELKAFWESKAGANTVLFATGDYNTTITREAVYETTDAMETMTSGIYKMGAQIAHTADSFSRDYANFIDHVIVNSNVTDVVEHHRIMDTYDGVRPSDHRPMIIYANYTANTSFASGEYDSVAGTLTDTVSSAEYVIQPTVPDGFTYTVKDAKNTVVGNNTAAAVSLTPGENKYTVTVKAPGTSIPDTVINATVTYNDSSLEPTVSATDALAAYYGKGEIHIALPQGTTSTTLSFSGGASYALYRNSACTTAQALTISGFTATRATYYLKVTADNYSAILPVKLYHPTTNTLPEKTLFCDDNYENLEKGNNAVWDDGTNVYVVPFSTRAFASVTALANHVNNNDAFSDGFGYVASGEYVGETASIKKNFSFYGANWDVDPLVRSNSAWTQNSARKAESTIYGYITVPAAITVAVKGFSFISKTPASFAALQLNSAAQYTLTMQIENNIFDYVTESTANSPIQGVGTQMKTGYIRDNIFRNNTIGRGITLRNLTGLEISGNHFYNLANSYALLCEIANGNNGDGNMDVSLIGNRFEECTATSSITTATAVNGAKITVRDNQYISLEGTALPIALSQGSGNPVDFAGTVVTITGNTFRNVNSGIYVNSNTAKVSQATITIQNNSLSECISYALRLNCADTSGNITADARYNYLDSATNPAAKITLSANATANYTPYYTDAALTTLSSGTLPEITGITLSGYQGVYDGAAHSVTLSGTKSGDTVLYSTDGYNYTTTVPSRTDVSETTVYVKVSRSGYKDWVRSTDLIITQASFQNITVTGFEGTYDGKSHSITVNGVPAGATLLYSTDNLSFTESKPAFTVPGSYNVFVRVKKANYKNFNTSATVIIETVDAPDIRVTPYLGKADGQHHNVTLFGTQEGDIVTYSVNGGAFVAEPSITEIGIYDVTVKVQRPYYKEAVINSRVTLIDANDGKIVSLIAQSPELMKEGAGFSALWTMLIDPSSSFDFAGEDIRFLSYGLLYSNSTEALQTYADQGALGETPTVGNVNRYVYDEDEHGLNRIYKTYRFKVKNISENKHRAAMAYIRFVYCGKTYEVYSTITDGSTLAGGLISGTGETNEIVDPFAE